MWNGLFLSKRSFLSDFLLKFQKLIGEQGMCTTNPYYASWESKRLLFMGYSKYKKEQILSVDCILYFWIYVKLYCPLLNLKFSFFLVLNLLVRSWELKNTFGGNNLLRLCNENKLADVKGKLIWKHFGCNNLKEIGNLTNKYIKSFIRKWTTN